MYKALTIILGAFVLGFLGYWVYTSQMTAKQPYYTAPTTTPATTPTVIEKTMKKIVVSLQADKNSNESGTATLTEENGKTKVTLNMTGFSSNVQQPAHIHQGKCPDVGAVKYPLTSVYNGTSETTLNVTLDDLQKALPLAINVHKNVPESNVYVSCGDLLF